MMRFPRLFLRGHGPGGAVVCSPVQTVPCRGSLLMEEPLRQPLSSCPSRTAVTGQKLPCAAALCRHPSARILTSQGQEDRWT